MIQDKNLIQLSSKSYLESDEKNDPHCKINELKTTNKDLILLSLFYIYLNNMDIEPFEKYIPPE